MRTSLAFTRQGARVETSDDMRAVIQELLKERSGGTVGSPNRVSALLDKPAVAPAGARPRQLGELSVLSAHLKANRPIRS